MITSGAFNTLGIEIDYSPIGFAPIVTEPIESADRSSSYLSDAQRLSRDRETEIIASFARRGLLNSGLLEQALTEARTAPPVRILSPQSRLAYLEVNLVALSSRPDYRVFRQQETFLGVASLGG